MLSLGFAPQLQRLRALLLPQPTGGGGGGKRRRPQVGSLDRCCLLGHIAVHARLCTRAVQKIDLGV